MRSNCFLFYKNIQRAKKHCLYTLTINSQSEGSLLPNCTNSYHSESLASLKMTTKPIKTVLPVGDYQQMLQNGPCTTIKWWFHATPFFPVYKFPVIFSIKLPSFFSGII